MLMKLGGDTEKHSKHEWHSADLCRMDVVFTNFRPELKACVARKQSANC